MDDEIVFENVWAVTIHTNGDAGQRFDNRKFDISVTLTPKFSKALPGWYVNREEFENPVSCFTDDGRAAELIFYTQSELDRGILPDSEEMLVKVVPYDES